MPSHIRDLGTFGHQADLARQHDFRWVGVASSPAGRDDVALGTEVDVRYAINGDARLAFSVRAGGPHVVMRVPAWISNQDLANLESPVHSSWRERLSSFATVVSYDQRGTGLSDPASLGDLPTLEGRADDLHAVVTAAALERVVLLAEALHLLTPAVVFTVSFVSRSGVVPSVQRHVIVSENDTVPVSENDIV